MPAEPDPALPGGSADPAAAVLTPTALLRAPLPDPPEPEQSTGPGQSTGVGQSTDPEQSTGVGQSAEPERGTGPKGKTDPVTVRGPAPARTVAELAELLAATSDPVAAREATGGWLAGERRRSPRTRDGYIRDVSWWLTWTAAHGIDPLTAEARAADLYAAAMDSAGLAPATRARRIAAAASWTAYLVRDGAAATNPFAAMERPKVSSRSSVRGAAMDELGQILAHARRYEPPRVVAILTLLAATAGRISSITGARLDGLGQHLGHTVLDVPVKGGTTQRLRLSALAIEALRTYLVEQVLALPAKDERKALPSAADGAPSGLPPQEAQQLDLLAATKILRQADPDRLLFVTRTGRPVDRAYVFRLLRRVAGAAGVPEADRLNLHGIRHTVLTYLLAQGTPLADVQDLAGHADPRTTRRYDDDQGALERSPVDAISDGLRPHRPRAPAARPKPGSSSKAR